MVCGLSLLGSGAIRPVCPLSSYRTSPPAPPVATSGFQHKGHTVSWAATAYRHVLAHVSDLFYSEIEEERLLCHSLLISDFSVVKPGYMVSIFILLLHTHKEKCQSPHIDFDM